MHRRTQEHVDQSIQNKAIDKNLIIKRNEKEKKMASCVSLKEMFSILHPKVIQFH